MILLFIGGLLLAAVVSVQYILLLNAVGPPRPPLTIAEHLGAFVQAVLSVWALVTLAAVALLYRVVGPA